MTNPLLDEGGFCDLLESNKCKSFPNVKILGIKTTGDIHFQEILSTLASSLRLSDTFLHHDMVRFLKSPDVVNRLSIFCFSVILHF
jgi:hypothetical protein